jgi:hypothetical protein
MILFDTTNENPLRIASDFTLTDGALTDTFLVLLIIIPMFLQNVHFMLAPLNEPYRQRSLLGTMPWPIFCTLVCYSWDVVILAWYLAIVSFYAVYFICSQDESNINDYMNRRASRNDTDTIMNNMADAAQLTAVNFGAATGHTAVGNLLNPGLMSGFTT